MKAPVSIPVTAAQQSFPVFPDKPPLNMWRRGSAVQPSGGRRWRWHLGREGWKPGGVDTLVKGSTYEMIMHCRTWPSTPVHTGGHVDMCFEPLS